MCLEFAISKNTQLLPRYISIYSQMRVSIYLTLALSLPLHLDMCSAELSKMVFMEHKRPWISSRLL